MGKKGNLIFFLNRRCHVGCASCNAAASAHNRAELSPQWLETFFNGIHDLEFSGYIIWTGGEPFLSFEALQKGISLACQKGFHSEILTGGAWFREEPGTLETLAAAGDFSLRISLDAEHQDRVPLPLIISLIKRALELGIEVNFTLRKIPGREESMVDFPAEIKKQLPEFYRENRSRSRWLHYIPHMPVSPRKNRSAVELKQKWRKACQMGFRDLVIGEDGLVYPCCGLFGIPGHERLAIGDPLIESLEALENRQRNDPLFQVLRDKGPYGICRELGLTPEIWNWPAYESPCHLCLALFHQYGDCVFNKSGKVEGKNKKSI